MVHSTLKSSIAFLELSEEIRLRRKMGYANNVSESLFDRRSRVLYKQCLNGCIFLRGTENDVDVASVYYRLGVTTRFSFLNSILRRHLRSAKHILVKTHAIHRSLSLIYILKMPSKSNCDSTRHFFYARRLQIFHTDKLGAEHADGGHLNYFIADLLTDENVGDHLCWEYIPFCCKKPTNRPINSVNENVREGVKYSNS